MRSLEPVGNFDAAREFRGQSFPYSSQRPRQGSGRGSADPTTHEAPLEKRRRRKSSNRLSTNSDKSHNAIRNTLAPPAQFWRRGYLRDTRGLKSEVIKTLDVHAGIQPSRRF